MAIRLYRAYSPGTRSRSSLFFDEITTNKPEKTLTFGKKSCSGRNNRGVITLGNRGGGHKRKYRIVHFNRKESSLETDVVTARVASIEYDPKRNSSIAHLYY
jgi:large subunit ribosomal protein L2